MIMKMKTALGIVVLTGLAACATGPNIPAEAFLPPPEVSYPVNASTLAERSPYRTEQVAPASQATSLWTSSPKSLFGDRRASKTGDILTVVVEFDEEAEISNSATQSRQNSENLGIAAFFGLPELANRELPDGATLSPAVDLNRSSNLSGNGAIKREEKMTLRLAAQVIDVMPNGYLKLAGQQQIMVNNEVRQLQVSGLVRTEDISRLNIITYDKIADARIYYGGHGQVSRAVKERVGNKLISKIIPF